MNTNMEDLETKMEIKIKGLRAMMVDGFSRVDQKLTAIEELLKKIVEAQNENGNPQEKRNGNVTEKKMGEGGFESGKNQDDGKTIAIRGGDGGPSHVSGAGNSLKSEISRDGDQGQKGLPWEAGSPHGWVGLYSHNYGKYSTQGTDIGRERVFVGLLGWVSPNQILGRKTPSFGRFHEGVGKRQFVNTLVERGNQRGSGLDGCGKKVAETGCVGKKSENVTEKDCSSLGKHAVKTAQDENFEDSSKSDKVTEKTYAIGEEEEEQTGSWVNKKDDKTDASLQDSLKPGQWGKKDSGLCFNAIRDEVNGKEDSMGADEGRDWSKIIEEKTDLKHGGGEKEHNTPLAQVAIEGSNEQDHEESQKPGSWGSKEEGMGSKRKHPDSPVEGRNDSPISSVPLTATRQRLSNFTTDEQEILNDIEPIMQSVQRIIYQDGYNDGDPLPTDDQTYILDNVLNHHPGKAQKLGAGVDYIMIHRSLLTLSLK